MRFIFWVCDDFRRFGNGFQIQVERKTMNYENRKTELWDFLIDYEIATESELQLVTSINGYNLESLESVLFVREGYRSLDQLLECEEYIR